MEPHLFLNDFLNGYVNNVKKKYLNEEREYYAGFLKVKESS